jgi:hypothetical protein
MNLLVLRATQHYFISTGTMIRTKHIDMNTDNHNVRYATFRRWVNRIIIHYPVLKADSGHRFLNQNTMFSMIMAPHHPLSIETLSVYSTFLLLFLRITYTSSNNFCDYLHLKAQKLLMQL